MMTPDKFTFRLMDTAGDGGAGGGGGPSGGDGGGGAAPAAPATPAAQPTDQPFYSSFEDEGLRDWTAAKGWKTPEALAKSALSLEKMAGAPADRLIKLPSDSADQGGWDAVYAKLGRPESPDKYGLEVPEGLPKDEAYLGKMAEAFHKAGLNPDQAKAITEANNAYVAEMQQQAVTDYETGVQAQRQELQREWGNGFERQMSAAQNAAKQLGFSPEMVDGIESMVGYADTMRFFADLAKKLGEDNFVGGDGGPRFQGSMTPEEAKVALATFNNDENNRKALMSKHHPRHNEVMKKRSELYSIIYPEQ